MIVRQKQILELLASKSDISVGELSDQFNVSEVTIRTDLNLLVHEKKIIRTHGRAQLLDERIRAEQSFDARKKQNFEKKINIGREAVKLVQSNDAVLLDSSSTALAMALGLRERTDLKDATIIPTGIWTAMELMGFDNINILIPCGYLRHTSGSITGLPSSDFFRSLNIQKAFLGAWGVSVDKGLTDSHLMEIALKRYIVNTVKEVIILADSSKFAQDGLAAYTEIEKITTLITDEDAPSETINQIRKKDVQVIIV